MPGVQTATYSGLSEQEAAERHSQAPPAKRRSSRSYLSIVRANVLTVFNLIIGAFGVLTLAFGDIEDALFLGVIVANSAIGIFQETRAKRQLDQLALLVAPDARVERSGSERRIAVEEVVVGDLVKLGPGDQVVADGTLLAASGLRLDESVLTGESEAVRRAEGEEIHSGGFVVEGNGAFKVTAVGVDSLAEQITGQARSFRHPRSPLEHAVNRMLYVTVFFVLTLGALLVYSLHHREVGLHSAVSTATAGVVSLVPEGLMVLVSLTYAVGAVRMSRRGVLAQQLNAIESLASVDTVCVDKTGTLTESTLRVIAADGVEGPDDRELSRALARIAASASSPNSTSKAIAEAYPAEPVPVLAEVPFSSRRRWSAIQTADGSVYLGAPGRLPVGNFGAEAERHQREGRRVLAVAVRGDPLPAEPGDLPPAGLRPIGIVALAEQLRPNIRETISYLGEQDIEVKVLSGDDPRTVAAIARDVGIPIGAVREGADIPSDRESLREFAASVTVVGRISPDGKRAVIQALADQGRYVAMIGDGVNDVPALKSSRLAIAQGSGTQMARSVSDLVLVSGDFGSVPPLVAEGRQVLRNIRRVARLYLSRSALAAFLILTIGTTSEAYPVLPRQLTIAGALTLGIPTFFLALAPSTGPWRPEGFGSEVARFAVPAGTLLGTGMLAAYLFAVHDLDLSVPDARTVALTSLIVGGIYLILALEAGGSRTRSTLVTAMCGCMLGLYVGAFVVTPARHFFALTVPSGVMVLTALLASAVSIVGLWLCGFTLRTDPPAEQPVKRAGT
jgi:cation-transporting P-type ATPase E